MAQPKQPLAGLRVLVTRPAHQAEPFCALLERAGAEPVRFPVLAIVPSPRAGDLAGLAGHLERYDLAIFISANAVQQGLGPLLRGRAWPAGTAIAAVGRSTATALAEHGLPVALVPEAGFNSEALLAMPALRDMAGRRVLIVRGEGGRETLAETLRGRGARVEYAEVYRRVLPEVGEAALRDAWRAGGIDAVAVTSVESLRNLWQLAGPDARPLLQAAPLILASGRIAETARELGCRGPLEVAEDATDAAMLAALQRRYRGQGGHAP